MSNNTLPFYTQASILDNYLHSSASALKPEIVQTILDAIESKPEIRDYFFRSRPDPSWARILWDNGFFSSYPTPYKTPEGYLVLPQWDVQNFLYSVADQVPETVVLHIEHIDAPGWYLSRAIQMLCLIPADMAVQTLPRILEWLKPPDLAGRIANASFEFLIALINGGQINSAFQLFHALTMPVLRSKYPYVSPSTHYGEPVVLIYEDVLDRDDSASGIIAKLQNENALEMIGILENHLKLALGLEAQDLNNPDFEFSAGWRTAVEDTGQDIFNSAKDQLLAALLTSLEELAQENTPSLEELIRQYLNDDHKIFHRIGLYLLQTNPNNFLQLVSQELLRKENLADHTIHHEFFLLLAQGFPYLSASQQEELTTTILDGPPGKLAQELADWAHENRGVDRKEYIQRFTKSWILDRLWMIRDHLSGDISQILDQLMNELGVPDHPEFTSWLSGGFWVQEISPLPKSDLEAMTPEELVNFLHSWEPDPRQDFGPKEVSINGLSKDLADVICANFEKYKGFLEKILFIQPEYSSAFFEWFRNSPQMSSDEWMICISLAERLLSPDFNYSVDRNWRWTRFQIVRLIEVGLNKDTHAIPADSLPRIRKILIALVFDPDPGVEEDRPPKGVIGHNNPYDVALNTVRPRALDTLINFACIQNKNILTQQTGENNETVQLEDRIKETLEKKLDHKQDSSRAVRSVFGNQLLNLYWLDKAWLAANIDQIFPEITDDESLWFFIAAWRPFIRHPYPDNLKDMLHYKYVQAIEILAYNIMASPLEGSSLAIHIVCEFLLGNYDLNSSIGQNSLIFRYFSKVNPQNRGYGANACWIICRNHPDEREKFWPKIKQLWEWRVQLAIAENHTSDYDQEMHNFAQLLTVAPETETIKSLWPLLEGMLPHIVNSNERHSGWMSLETFLAREVKRDPVRSIQFYQLMREKKREPFPGNYESAEAREILETGAARIESRKAVLSLIDMLARSHNHKFRDIYEKYA